VTDADLVLGYLDPATFLGGRMPLDRTAAERAIERDVAAPLGLGVAEAASGVYEIVNVDMAAGVRDLTVRRGLDARDFPLVVAGGAGPVHASAIARELGTPRLIVPRDSSIFCAAGMLMCDFRHDFAESNKATLEELDADVLRRIWGDMRRRGEELLRSEGVQPGAVTSAPSLDMRYVGQWWELTLPLPAAYVDDPDLAYIESAFHEQHERVLGHHSLGASIELLTLRLDVVGRTEKPEIPAAGSSADDDPSGAYLHDRPIWSPVSRTFVEAAVFDGDLLAGGAQLDGPAVIELATTSIVVLPASRVTVDAAGAFVVDEVGGPAEPILPRDADPASLRPS
jgi:N-methylhydantoinase A